MGSNTESSASANRLSPFGLDQVSPLMSRGLRCSSCAHVSSTHDEHENHIEQCDIQALIYEDNELTLDAEGDLCLLVGPPEKARRFLVSSKIMKMISKVFRQMLNPEKGWRESSEKEITFPEDDSLCMGIILAVTHHRLEILPNNLTIKQVFDLSELSNKYDIVYLMRPQVRRWFDQLEGAKDGEVWWPTIAWIFGYEDKFRTALKKLVCTIKFDTHGDIVSGGGLYLYHLPAGVLESVQEIRYKAISHIFDLVDAEFKSVLSGTYCSEHSSKEQSKHHEYCDKNSLWNYAKALQKVNLLHSWSGAKNAEEFGGSVEDLASAVSHIVTTPFFDIPRKNASNPHENCNVGKNLHLKVESYLFDQIPSALTPQLKTHFENRKL